MIAAFLGVAAATSALSAQSRGAGPVADYDEASLGPLWAPLPPITVTRPAGHGFQLDGHEVTWQNWSFHVRPDQRDRLVTERLPEAHPRRSVWVMVEEKLAREHDARLDMDMHRPALWRVVSKGARNHVGYATSYQLAPGHNVHTLLSEDDYPRRRAAFIDHHLWVTPYSAEERYAAGMYPTLSKPGEGLPQWTSGNRGIEDRDIVLWYTMGMHHVARAEDWPVMPVAWHSFELRPFDFFNGNPAMRLPRAAQAAAAGRTIAACPLSGAATIDEPG
jgi:Cu2+-containing amine oxidase